MVNNEGVELSEMPQSMSKKWTKAQYGRERYLAKEFLKSKLEQMTEGKLTEKQSAAVQRMAKQGMWVVTDGGRETIKVVKNERAAKMLVKKLKKSGKYNSPEAKAIKLEGKLKEAISGADRKILFILIREIVRGLKSKIKNMDVNNKSHLNRVGSSILAIIRAMSYSPDNVNYKNFKKYFPKNFNSKLIQKKLKQFHSQNDKVQVTLVTQAIKNELGAGVKEGKLSEQKLMKILLNKKDMSKLQKAMKKYPFKSLPKFKQKGNDIELNVPKKEYNKAVEFFMKNKLNPRG